LKDPGYEGVVLSESRALRPSVDGTREPGTEGQYGGQK
jgi:hypothetical protein